MDELRLNNKVKIETSEKAVFEGKITAIEYDRVYIQTDEQYKEQFNNISELDELKINADTHFGLKTMISCVIDKINRDSTLVVENNPGILIEQKREFMRVVCNFDFLIKVKEETIHAQSKNISAGGIAFNTSYKLNIGDEIEIILSEDIFEKEIKCEAKIIKIKDENYIAQFMNISENIESRITKYVFKNVSKSSTGS